MSFIDQLQYDEHYKLFSGYLSKTSQLLANPRSDRDWKKEFNYNYAGAVLHQLYFEHLDAPPAPIGETMYGLITNNFGSVKVWKEDFAQTALNSKSTGWAYLCTDPEGNLHNIGTDSHDEFLVGFKPLIILDVYEHAYMVQYGVDKKSYIEDFIKNLNWRLVQKRLD